MKPHFLCSVSVPVLCQASCRFSPPSSSQDLVCSILFYSMILLIAVLIAVLVCQLQESLYLA